MLDVDINDLLQYIPPAPLSYQEWVGIGMILKDEGYPPATWEAWSQRDPARYHPGECEKKWDSFSGSPRPLTVGTLIMMAKQNGWSGYYDGPNEILGWDAIITEDDQSPHSKRVIRPEWVEREDFREPETWDPVKDLTLYLTTLFDSTDYVGYVTECYESNGRKVPQRGNCTRTAGELVEALRKCNGDIGMVFGDYDPEVGAWIRFNPLDGQGVKNANVTEYRYALVEGDNQDKGVQMAIMRELELPIAAMVYSGGKSIHAIVKVDASGPEEYRKRVDYLYDVCKRNGLQVDQQNRNPSRLSRMPGVIRNGHKQFLICTHVGKETWREWQEWVESINDNLPDFEELSVFLDDLPELAPPLIDGILRQGHKMLLAGPSKAGKSFALIELCIAVAEGKPWLGWQCAQGRVLYVNLELDRASCLHRFRDVYQAMGLQPYNVDNIDVWNLRGRSLPMDQLVPCLTRRAQKRQYAMVVIDPIYKVITGDENSADQMAKFCNQFDKICHELGASVIYCHHHSKGLQGQKRSMDRASGSGVFARDPDALLDMVQLDLTDDMRAAAWNQMECRLIQNFLDRWGPAGWADRVSQDDLVVGSRIFRAAEALLPPEGYKYLQGVVLEAQRAALARTAWRIDATLREFPRPEPLDIWFAYPIHTVGDAYLLKDAKAEGEVPAWQSQRDKQKERRAEAKRQEQEAKREEFANRFSVLAANDPQGRVSRKALIDSYTEDFDFEGYKKPYDAARMKVSRWMKAYGYGYDPVTGLVSPPSD